MGSYLEADYAPCPKCGYHTATTITDTHPGGRVTSWCDTPSCGWKDTYPNDVPNEEEPFTLSDYYYHHPSEGPGLGA